MFLRMMQSLALILLTFLLVACGGDSDPLPTVAPDADDTNTTQSENTSTTSTDAGSVDDSAVSDVPVGDYTLTVSGAAASSDTFTTERNRQGISFDPFGTGTNAEGPYNIELNLDGTYNDAPVHIELNLITNGVLAPGTYTLSNSMSNDEDSRAYVQVTVPDAGFADEDLGDFRDPQGTLTITSMNLESVSGTTSFTATDEDSGESITVEAAFNQIPFEPDTEVEFTYGGIYDGFDNPLTVVRGSGDTNEVSFNSGDSLIMLNIPVDIEPGTYDLAADASPIFVTFGTVTGTVTLDRADEYYTGSLDLTFVEDEGEGTVSGTFEYIEVPADE